MSEYLGVYQRTYGQASSDKLITPKDKQFSQKRSRILKFKKYLAEFISMCTIKSSILWCFFAVSGLLISQVNIRGGMLPLALSLLLAFKLERSRYFLPVLVGSLLGIIWQFGLLSITSLVIPLAFYQGWQKSKLATYRILGLLCFSLIYIVTEIVLSWGLDSLFSLSILGQEVLAVLITVFLALLLVPAVNKIDQGLADWSLTKEELVSFILLGSAIFVGLQGFYIDSFSIARVFAMLVVLSLGFFYGGGTGASAGTVLGIIMSFYSLSQIAIGLFALSGLFAGVFKDFGKIMSVFAFWCSGSLVVFYMGEPYIIMTLLKELVFVAVLFLILPKSSLIGIFPNIIGNTDKSSDYSADKIINYKLNEFSHLFEEMANIFDGHSDTEEHTVGGTEVEDFIHIIVNRVCDGCSKMDFCWEKNFFETYKQFLMTLSQFDNISDSHEELPDYLLDHCIRTSLLKENIYKILEQNRLDHISEKAPQCDQGKILSEQMRGISELLQKMSLYKFVNACIDEDLQEDIAKIITDLGYNCEEVRVTKENSEELNIELLLTGQKQLEKINTSAIVNSLSQFTGRKLAVVKQEGWGEKTRLANDKIFIRLTTEQQLSVVSGKVQLNKWGESFSGDNCVSKKLTTGEHLLLLSDGMGSGSRADQESNVAVKLIAKLLDYGFDKKMVINAANSLLSVTNRVDSFATVDMAVIDLHTGIGEFCKAGAVTSFIKTCGGIEKVDAGSLPAGIIESVEPKYLTYNLKPNDYLIMVSDGVYELGHNDEWLENILVDLPPLHPQKLAEKIVEKVKRRHHYHNFSDDVSVLVSQINDNSSNSVWKI